MGVEYNSSTAKTGLETGGTADALLSDVMIPCALLD